MISVVRAHRLWRLARGLVHAQQRTDPIAPQEVADGCRRDRQHVGKGLAVAERAAVGPADGDAGHAYRGDSTLTGQGRVFALHMFEARQQCSVTATVASTGDVLERIDLKVERLPPRMICDPVVYFSRAQNLCRTRRGSDPAFDFHLVMDAKRTTDFEYQRIVDAPSFCAAQYEYRLFANNDWLR